MQYACLPMTFSLLYIYTPFSTCRITWLFYLLQNRQYRDYTLFILQGCPNTSGETTLPKLLALG